MGDRTARSTRTTDAGRVGPEWTLSATTLACLGLIAFSASALIRNEPLPAFAEVEAGELRKSEFFAFLRPLVETENARVLGERERLLEIAQRAELGSLDRLAVVRLAREYGLDLEELGMRELIDALLLRVDAVPISLALAQGAKESGWGTSRFAREGNNLFGEWCYEPGCGLVPERRSAGRRHEVERFATPGDSVESYLRNINTHVSYEAFRAERARLREAREPLSGLRLADTLGQYSQRRKAYVDEVKSLILSNDLSPAGGSELGEQ